MFCFFLPYLSIMSYITLKMCPISYQGEFALYSLHNVSWDARCLCMKVVAIIGNCYLYCFVNNLYSLFIFPLSLSPPSSLTVTLPLYHPPHPRLQVSRPNSAFSPVPFSPPFTGKLCVCVCLKEVYRYAIPLEWPFNQHSRHRSSDYFSGGGVYWSELPSVPGWTLPFPGTDLTAKLPSQAVCFCASMQACLRF